MQHEVQGPLAGLAPAAGASLSTTCGAVWATCWAGDSGRTPADRAQHAQAVADGVQIADAKPADVEAADFDHSTAASARRFISFRSRTRPPAGPGWVTCRQKALCAQSAIAAKQQAASDEAPVAQHGGIPYRLCRALHERSLSRSPPATRAPTAVGSRRGRWTRGVDHDDDIAGCRRETLPECRPCRPFRITMRMLGINERDFRYHRWVTINQDNSLTHSG